MNRVYRWALTLGLIASCAGVAGLSAAKAQDWDDVNWRQHIRRDQQDIRRDQARLRDLERQRREEGREGDWRDARALDRQIDQLRWHIDRDRQDVRQDRRQSRRDGYWEDNYPHGNRRWNGDWDDRRDRDDHPRWNNNRRWHRSNPPRRRWNDDDD